MKKISLNDIDLLRVGNDINFSGVIWNDSKTDQKFITLFPDINIDDLDGEWSLMELTADEWLRFLRQTDVQETEILVNDDGKIKKAIYRKCQRQIDSRVQWQVFARDKFTCRYCGKTGVPLTVDHIQTWEKLGPTIPLNLLSTCKKCNRLRGNTQYEKWLNSTKYQNVSKNLPSEIKEQNIDLIDKLPEIKKLSVTNLRSR